MDEIAQAEFRREYGSGNTVGMRVLFSWLLGLMLFGSGTFGSGTLAFGQIPEPAGKAGDVRFAPKPFVTKMYYEGSLTIGRVGHEAILKRDILHQLKKQAYIVFLEQEKEQLPKDADARTRQMFKEQVLNEFMTNPKIYSGMLDSYIKKLLFYNDFVVSRPKEQVTEQKKKLSDTYDREYLPQLRKQLGVERLDQMSDFFKNELESTIEQDRRLFIYETIAVSWMEYNLGEDQYVPSALELRRYYEAHREPYRVEARVHWQCMTIKTSNYPTQQEARNKIAQMGNLVLQETVPAVAARRFEEISRTMSEDIFAAKGGDRGWIRKGSLKSAQMESMLFSEALPVGAVSQIIEDNGSLMILRVVERENENWKPFVEVQEDVKKRLLAERRSTLLSQYEDLLSKRFTIELYNISDEDRKAHLEALFKDNRSVTGRDVY
ncbi:MAG: peptidyl-prolyl cis-trans isomerase [Thermoguttaceae bacterium]|nr:peptidyl-prolyl cis-trans isomerase [Thermoguttaceae bacterium]